MMSDPFRRIIVSLSERFGMLPSVFVESASMADVVEILAYDTTNDEDWAKRYKFEKEVELINTFTPEQHEAWILSKIGDD